MKKGSLLLTAVAVLMMVVTTQAATVTQLAAGENKTWNAATTWDDGFMPAAGNDYISLEGAAGALKRLRTTPSENNNGPSAVFAGDSLTMSKYGWLMGKQIGGNSVTIGTGGNGNLILLDGAWASMNGNSIVAGAITWYIGDLVINSTTTTSVLGLADTGSNWAIEGNLTGAGMVTIKSQNHPAKVINGQISIASVGNFTGTLTVEPDVTLAFGSDTNFGGSLTLITGTTASGKLKVTKSIVFGPGKLVANGVTIANGTYTGAALTALGANFIDSGGRLVVGNGVGLTPDPANGQGLASNPADPLFTAVPVNKELSWTLFSNPNIDPTYTIQYRLFMDTDQAKVSNGDAGCTYIRPFGTGASFDPIPDMAIATQYFWRVDTQLRWTGQTEPNIITGTAWTFKTADPNTVPVDYVRIQVLSSTLVRIELRGPQGFEDRPTFHITERTWPGATVTRSSAGGYDLFQTADFIVKVPSGATSLEGIVITNPGGAMIWSMPTAGSDFFTNNRYWIPNPNNNTQAWAIADTPRYVPGLPTEPWGGGYNLAPSGTPNNGWDMNNSSPDVYVFLPKGDSRKLRSDYLTLTGRTDLIPLKALGCWHSRYYPYTQQTALEMIDTYRNRNIPLDIFVVDTHWRVGGSVGYEPDPTLWWDMGQFFSDAHNKHVELVLSDHPNPQGNCLDYAEVNYINTGVRGKFDIGLDTWWYDRNWRTSFLPPAGINKETFGMYMYHWLTLDCHPDRRPFIMANVDGIDSGSLNRAPNIAGHRYTMQWTGDTPPDFASLGREVRNAVYSGVYAPYAYVSADLGGHIANPTVEGYCRWLQYGALSPIFRPHCTKYEWVIREPWAWADPVEEVFREFVQMRMRLLPVFYTAARENYDTGEPILKRCDLNYPGYTEAQNDYQYLLGNDILVAPVITGSGSNGVPSAWLNNGSGSAGLTGEYFSDKALTGSPTMTRTDANVFFSWDTGNPGGGLPNDNFSVRWTGNITVGEGQDIKLGVSSDDGCRLWIDDVLVIDQWVNRAETTSWTTGTFQNGHTYTIKLEYYENAGGAACKLIYENPLADPNKITERNLWIPPGTWTNLWTGNTVQGPATHTASVTLKQTPLFVKEASIIPLAPDMQYTGQAAWDPITLDIYPAADRTAAAELYEDDGTSNSYKSGSYRTTAFEASADNTKKQVIVTIDPAQGTYAGALSSRSWVLRLRPCAGWPQTPQFVTVNGALTAFSILPKDPDAMPFEVTGGSPAGDVIQIQIPSASVSAQRTIVVNFESFSPADFDRDHDVDLVDAHVLFRSWLKIPGEPGYDSRANLYYDALEKVSLDDFAEFAKGWLD